MQYKQTSVLSLFLLLSCVAFSQTTYFPEGSQEYILAERMEIKSQKDSVLNFSKLKPFSRKRIINALEQYYYHPEGASVTKVDRANFETAFINSPEWADTQIRSKHPFLKRFYQSPANLYEVNIPDFFLAINPVFQYYVGKEQNNDEHIFLNSRGISLRGRIADKIGFSSYITDNQERDPLYVQNWENTRKSVPGQGFYKDFKITGYDYLDARGYLTFNATRYIDIQFGYDKNFIGNGQRSLFLSDFSSPFLFLKLNTRIWRLNLQNLFVELNSAQRLNADQLFPKKYAAIHHLDISVTKWLNVGLFEAVVFGRTNHFEFGYLNPIIFYRSIEQQNGSFDNSVLGLDMKANLARKIQVYGQLMLDEFNLVEMRKGSGWWGNKHAYQLGVKYIDAFSIPNLDLQLESNRVRPFTYSHRDSVANYTHYNQPLAHPLGANFQEIIAQARYQPFAKLMLVAKGIYYIQGQDTAGHSYGSNIFLPSVPPYRTMDYGYNLGMAIKGKTALASFLVSYQWKPNFFIEANAVYRKVAATVVEPGGSTFMMYAGIRWNMHRREFEF